jgi:chemotaxis protein methyltransferase CheR
MAPDGMLYLGGAETVLGITGRFEPLPGERGVYGLAPVQEDKRPLARARTG